MCATLNHATSSTKTMIDGGCRGVTSQYNVKEGNAMIEAQTMNHSSSRSSRGEEREGGRCRPLSPYWRHGFHGHGLMFEVEHNITTSLHRALDFVVAIGRQTARRQTDLIPTHIIIDNIYSKLHKEK